MKLEVMNREHVVIFLLNLMEVSTDENYEYVF